MSTARRRVLAVIVAGVGAAVIPARGAAQPAAPRSTQDGVYSAPQAERGKDLYLTLCQSCHAAITHTGPIFRRNWSGRRLAELYTFMSTRMPKSEPASLSPETYADLLAYMLQLNKMPGGSIELPPDIATLQQVRIQLAAPPKRAKR